MPKQKNWVVLNLLCLQEAFKAEEVRLQAALAEEERHASATQQSSSSQLGEGEEEEGDELDAFMGQVAVQLEQDKVSACNQLLNQ